MAVESPVRITMMCQPCSNIANREQNKKNNITNRDYLSKQMKTEQHIGRN